MLVWGRNVIKNQKVEKCSETSLKRLFSPWKVVLCYSGGEMSLTQILMGGAQCAPPPSYRSVKREPLTRTLWNFLTFPKYALLMFIEKILSIGPPLGCLRHSLFIFHFQNRCFFSDFFKNIKNNPKLTTAPHNLKHRLCLS